MIEYRVEYVGKSRYHDKGLFGAYKYVDGRCVSTIDNYISAERSHEMIKNIIEGEGTYIVVPKTVKEIRFNS